MLLVVAGLVVAFRVPGASVQVAVGDAPVGGLQFAFSDVHGGPALVAVVPPIAAGDIFLEADSLDICQGFVHECVLILARPICHSPAPHHYVAVGGASVG